MQAPNINLVELTDEQLQAFRLLFPHVKVAEEQDETQQPDRKQERRRASEWRPVLEAYWKKKHPYS